MRARVRCQQNFPSFPSAFGQFCPSLYRVYYSTGSYCENILFAILSEIFIFGYQKKSLSQSHCTLYIYSFGLYGVQRGRRRSRPTLGPISRVTSRAKREMPPSSAILRPIAYVSEVFVFCRSIETSHRTHLTTPLSLQITLR